MGSLQYHALDQVLLKRDQLSLRNCHCCCTILSSNLVHMMTLRCRCARHVFQVCQIKHCHGNHILLQNPCEWNYVYSFECSSTWKLVNLRTVKYECARYVSKFVRWGIAVATTLFAKTLWVELLPQFLCNSNWTWYTQVLVNLSGRAKDYQDKMVDALSVIKERCSTTDPQSLFSIISDLSKVRCHEFNQSTVLQIYLFHNENSGHNTFNIINNLNFHSEVQYPWLVLLIVLYILASWRLTPSITQAGVYVKCVAKSNHLQRV